MHHLIDHDTAVRVHLGEGFGGAEQDPEAGPDRRKAVDSCCGDFPVVMTLDRLRGQRPGLDLEEGQTVCDDAAEVLLVDPRCDNDRLETKYLRPG